MLILNVVRDFKRDLELQLNPLRIVWLGVAIKKVPGKVWESDEKLWLLPADEERAIRKAARVIVKCL